LIKGFLGTTLLDFPGKIAAMIFIGGCNFRCPFCHNPGLVKESDLNRLEGIPTEEVLIRLRQRAGFIDGVVISGGEPFVYRDLLELIKKIDCLGLAVKIDTNGYFPVLLQEVLESGLVEYVAMDIKTSLSKYPLAAGREVDYRRIRESIALIKGSAVNYEFRTTMVPGIVEKKDFLTILHTLKGAHKFVLQQFRPNRLLNPDFMKLKPYPAETLENFARLARDFVENVVIKNTSWI
jgi:pyruvate formate lyase activating enzyme